LEALHCNEFAGVLRKAGLGTPSTPKTKRKPERKFIHDGRLYYALIQLTLRLCRLNPRTGDRRKIKWKAAKLAKRIRCQTKEDGRVGEPWRVSGPSLKRGGCTSFVTRPHRAGGLLSLYPQGKQEQR
jgi:hypothetical protein